MSKKVQSNEAAGSSRSGVPPVRPFGEQDFRPRGNLRDSPSLGVTEFLERREALNLLPHHGDLVATWPQIGSNDWDGFFLGFDDQQIGEVHKRMFPNSRIVGTENQVNEMVQHIVPARPGPEVVDPQAVQRLRNAMIDSPLVQTRIGEIPGAGEFLRTNPEVFDRLGLNLKQRARLPPLEISPVGRQQLAMQEIERQRGGRFVIRDNAPPPPIGQPLALSEKVARVAPPIPANQPRPPVENFDEFLFNYRQTNRAGQEQLMRELPNLTRGRFRIILDDLGASELDELHNQMFPGLPVREINQKTFNKLNEDQQRQAIEARAEVQKSEITQAVVNEGSRGGLDALGTNEFHKGLQNVPSIAESMTNGELPELRAFNEMSLGDMAALGGTQASRRETFGLGRRVQGRIVEGDPLPKAIRLRVEEGRNELPEPQRFQQGNAPRQGQAEEGIGTVGLADVERGRTQGFRSATQPLAGERINEPVDLVPERRRVGRGVPQAITREAVEQERVQQLAETQARRPNLATRATVGGIAQGAGSIASFALLRPDNALAFTVGNMVGFPILSAIEGAAFVATAVATVGLDIIPEIIVAPALGALNLVVSGVAGIFVYQGGRWIWKEVGSTEEGTKAQAEILKGASGIQKISGKAQDLIDTGSTPQTKTQKQQQQGQQQQQQGQQQQGQQLNQEVSQPRRKTKVKAKKTKIPVSFQVSVGASKIKVDCKPSNFATPSGRPINKTEKQLIRTAGKDQAQTIVVKLHKKQKLNDKENRQYKSARVLARDDIPDNQKKIMIDKIVNK